MKPRRASKILIILAVAAFCTSSARAETVVFFDPAQTTNLVQSGYTSDTISSEGYLFTFTRDKQFTGGVGLTNPIGRYLRVPWPQGMEAQAVTSGSNPGPARIEIKRQDHQVFDIPSFTFKLLANTGGAGAALEIMPLLNGEDGLPNPAMFDATGYYGQNFSYSPGQLKGFDAYKITLYVDFALTSLTSVDASPPRPSLEITPASAGSIQLSWSAESSLYTLECATNLPSTSWAWVTNNVANDGRYAPFRSNAPALNSSSAYGSSSAGMNGDRGF